MAFLHCHECDWEQDDFWSPNGYNPLEAERMALLREDLFRKEICLGACDDQPAEVLTGRQFVIRELIRIIKVIRAMAVPTLEEWEKVRHGWTCPSCGSTRWDID